MFGMWSVSELLCKTGTDACGHPPQCDNRTMCIAWYDWAALLITDNTFARSTEHRRRYLSHLTRTRRIAQ